MSETRFLRLSPSQVLAQRPWLADEYDLDNTLSWSELSFFESHIEVWWRCRYCGYRFIATPYKRFIKNRSCCPVCNGKVVNELNNLKAKYPNLTKEYLPQNGLSADQVYYKSQRKVNWRCLNCSHQWPAKVYDRTIRGQSCPACAHRVVTYQTSLLMTHPDLAKEYCADNLLPTDQVLATTHKKLKWQCLKCEEKWQATGKSRANQGEGCPYCSNQKVGRYNNLLITHPDLAKEYDAEKNKLPADQVLATTQKKLWWKCLKCNWSWPATGDNRVNKGAGCPYCANQKPSNKNNLLARYPNLAKEFSSYNLLSPIQVVAGSAKKYRWICPEGHDEYLASPDHRSRGRGCPKCGRLKSSKNFLKKN